MENGILADTVLRWLEQNYEIRHQTRDWYRTGPTGPTKGYYPIDIVVGPKAVRIHTQPSSNPDVHHDTHIIHYEDPELYPKTAKTIDAALK
jgi:hypothetical protein